jgi:hypothetical protein
LSLSVFTLGKQLIESFRKSRKRRRGRAAQPVYNNIARLGKTALIGIAPSIAICYGMIPRFEKVAGSEGRHSVPLFHGLLLRCSSFLLQNCAKTR